MPRIFGQASIRRKKTRSMIDGEFVNQPPDHGLCTVRAKGPEEGGKPTREDRPPGKAATDSRQTDTPQTHGDSEGQGNPESDQGPRGASSRWFASSFPSKTSKTRRAAVVSAPYRPCVGGGRGGETKASQSAHVCELVPVKNVQNSRDS